MNYMDILAISVMVIVFTTVIDACVNLNDFFYKANLMLFIAAVMCACGSVTIMLIE